LKIYYAHPICFYESEIEKKQLTIIRSKFKDAEIINPANYPSSSMDFYFSLVEKSEKIIFSCLLGKITSGVGKEVNYALNKGKEVYMLNEKELVPIKVPVNYISRQSTVELYHEWWKQQEVNLR